jgi:hypothetical protein
VLGEDHEPGSGAVQVNGDDSAAIRRMGWELNPIRVPEIPLTRQCAGEIVAS